MSVADTTIVTRDYGEMFKPPTLSEGNYAIRNSETNVVKRRVPPNVLYAFDGTDNNAMRAKENNTNIWILAKRYIGRSHYMAGVGSSDRSDLSVIPANPLANPLVDDAVRTVFSNKNVDFVLGGYYGVGARSKLDAMFVQFESDFANSRGKIEIDIIGFSRGAAMAREFANMINDYSVPSKSEWDALDYVKRDYSYFDLLRQGCEPRVPWSSSTAGPAFSALRKGETSHLVLGPDGRRQRRSTGTTEPTLPRDPKKIRFLGIFDTVGSFGTPGDDYDKPVRMIIPGNVQYVRHAIALNEFREDFPLTRIGENSPTRIEKGFAGAHCDVGGGYEEDNLAAKEPYGWMRREAKSIGVPFGLTKEDCFEGSFVKDKNGNETTKVHYHDSYHPNPVFTTLGWTKHPLIDTPLVWTTFVKYSERGFMKKYKRKVKPRRVFEAHNPAPE